MQKFLAEHPSALIGVGLIEFSPQFHLFRDYQVDSGELSKRDARRADVVGAIERGRWGDEIVKQTQIVEMKHICASLAGDDLGPDGVSKLVWQALGQVHGYGRLAQNSVNRKRLELAGWDSNLPGLHIVIGRDGANQSERAEVERGRNTAALGGATLHTIDDWFRLMEKAHLLRNPQTVVARRLPEGTFALGLACTASQLRVRLQGAHGRAQRLMRFADEAYGLHGLLFEAVWEDPDFREYVLSSRALAKPNQEKTSSDFNRAFALAQRKMAKEGRFDPKAYAFRMARLLARGRIDRVQRELASFETLCELYALLLERGESLEAAPELGRSSTALRAAQQSQNKLRTAREGIIGRVEEVFDGQGMILFPPAFEAFGLPDDEGGEWNVARLLRHLRLENPESESLSEFIMSYLRALESQLLGATDGGDDERES